MRGELIINGCDAYKEWGVSMGDKFLDNLVTPGQMKDFVESKSRLEDGSRMVVIPKVDSRDVTLTFTISGADKASFTANREAFLAVLCAGEVAIRVPDLDYATYHLVYTGKNASYAMNRMRTFATFTAKFTEPNPRNRK